MSAFPSYYELEQAGHDAGALLDAHEAEIERAIPMAADPLSRAGLREDLKNIRALRETWFERSAA